ncbi:putative E3 ubiquitin-protein ligase RF298 [Iris pallida]|uniref:E3 ubiquitin-protein ligase RF298 n=1 Tax=Iris pallida TaxID=29817 RepID=A0AAX6EFG8_IRIPA|nr:putative E3 ubiquitin-protein ligase RF298 [Iris pallida]
MAAMVARGSSPLAPSSSIPEKGSRNKRKFRADPPVSDPNPISHPPESDLPNYELFPIDKPSENPNPEHHSCDVCQNHVFVSREEVEPDEFQEADWSDLTETQLEETVLSNLETIFRTAVRTIASYGYAEEVAADAVLRSGVFYGCKDTVTNIVENALAVLRSGQELDSPSGGNSAEEFRKLGRSVLAEMVNVLLEMRPSFSVGNAMWCLLISDMNVTHACAMDCNTLGSMGSRMISASSVASQAEQESNSSGSSSQTMLEANTSGQSKPNPSLHCPQNTSQTETPTVAGLPNLPSGKFSALINAHDSSSSVDLAKNRVVASSERVMDLSSSISPSSQQEMKPSGGSGSKKGQLSSSKRESILRQKSVHLEKSYRMFGSKAAIRAGKHGLGSLLLDKKSKSASESYAMKHTMMKLNKAVGSDTPQADPTINLSFGDPAVIAAISIPPPVPIANTELSLSLSVPSTGTDNCGSSSLEVSFPADKLCGTWIPQDKKDEMLLKLVPRVRELQAQLQEWNDWGQQKVMQAARRLAKDKPELQSLRQEKEEVARLKKEKQTLEENTRKKLAEMEIALSRASVQVDTTNATARSLQVENSELRKEMEAARLRAAESAASCQEVSSRETKTLKQFQSWEKQKALFHEELASEKRKLSQLQQQLEQAKEYRDQLEARWKLEEKAKDEALKQASTERKEREQIEVSGRSKGNAMRLKAETDLQRYRDGVKKLEQQMAQLRLRTDSPKVAALTWGMTDGSTRASRLSDGRKDDGGHAVSKFFDSQEPEEVQRERECVMCLSEEMSVVFLPCAHQVVCTKCNELHEKQGMGDCPSCRTPIQRRICVRSAEY